MGERIGAAAPGHRRRRTLVYATTAVVVAVVLGTSVWQVSRAVAGPTGPSVPTFGMSTEAARCGPAVRGPATGADVHVGPGTASPGTTRVDYPGGPPASGPHFPVPVYPNLAFYTVSDAPQVEQLVHNLEHGYTILWYDPTLPEPALDQLAELAIAARGTTPKFIAAPWDPTRGELPGDATIALTHWGADAGYRQLCAALSGQVVADFLAAHPASDSPEPDAP